MPRKKTLTQLKPGAKSSLTREVEFHRTIKYYRDVLPAVLSTPSMIGQMEVSAATLLQPYLPEGMISLGTHINVSHRAPAFVDEKIRTTAVFRKKYQPNNGGRDRYVFEVEARVGRRLVGAGTVERAIVGHSNNKQHRPARKSRSRKRTRK